MHESQIRLLEKSFAEVFASSDEASALFYERLFARDPALRRLFKADLTKQGRKLMASLALVVNSLRKPDIIVPALENMAIRHVGYGVCDEHYAAVGATLLETLSLFFGPRFTPELRAAWAEAYRIVSSVMQDAARRSKITVPSGRLLNAVADA